MKKKIGLSLVIMAVLLFVVSFYSIYQVNSQVIENIDKVHNSFVSNYDISNVEVKELGNKLDEIEKDLTKDEITLNINNKKYKYTIYEMGVSINKQEIESEIKDYESELDYWTLYNSYSKNSLDEKVYDYKYIIDEEKLNTFLINLKKRVDVKPKMGRLEMNSNRNLEFVGEVVGFSLDIEKNKDIIKNTFLTNNYNISLNLVGENTTIDNPLKVIDTKVSSFTTEFDDTVSRKYNLIAGAKMLDSKVIEPGEVFSFFENAGPYTSINDYVYYLGVMGNGVCQVATTLYNAELLAGLTTVTRYNHGKKSVYVDGGLDATVAVTSGYVTDFKYKNDYDYPVYISAFVSGNKLTIELWSNKEAKKGLEYKTESVRLGYGSYQAYRYTYKDGELVNTEDLGKSYYFAE